MSRKDAYIDGIKKRFLHKSDIPSDIAEDVKILFPDTLGISGRRSHEVRELLFVVSDVISKATNPMVDIGCRVKLLETREF